MNRTLTPELLDLLPPHDAGALRSRRDLRLINRTMGNAAWWRSRVAPELRPSDRVLEIGPGDAGFSLFPERVVDGIDRMPRPSAWPPHARWHRTCVQRFAGWSDYTVIVGNLVFHHFCSRELRELGDRLVPHARVIAACEPRRGRRFQWAFRALGALAGFGGITRHDGIASIAAGFREHELPQALGLHNDTWRIHIGQSCLGAYRMLAVRRR